MLITDQVATAPCTDCFQARSLTLRQSLCGITDAQYAFPWAISQSGRVTVKNLRRYEIRKQRKLRPISFRLISDEIDSRSHIYQKQSR